MAVDGKRVVAFTPYGRELTVSLLKDYMIREHERGIVDEWWLLMNTDEDQVDDVSHFSFFHQRKHLLQTDVLQWYRKIADDKCL